MLGANGASHHKAKLLLLGMVVIVDGVSSDDVQRAAVSGAD